MYGTNVGDLMVLSNVGQVNAPVWQRQGTQGNHWNQAAISLHSDSNYKVSQITVPKYA